MARTEARIRCAVWRDRDFTSLPLAAQGLYWMLLSQPDVSLAGIVPYNPHKWDHLCGDQATAAALEPLEVTDKVMVDPTTGELWIRTFVKHDGVLGGVKTRAGMWSAWHNILSAGIRWRFVEQMRGRAVTVDEAEVGVVDEALSQGWVTQDDLDDARDEFEKQAGNGVSGGASDRASDQGQDGVSSGVSPRARADSASDSASASDTLAPPKATQKKDAVFDAVIESCGLDLSELTDTARGAANRAVKELKKVGATPEGIHARARVHLEKWPDATLTPSSLAKNYAQLGASPRKAAPKRDPSVCPDCGYTPDKHDDQLCAVVKAG